MSEDELAIRRERNRLWMKEKYRKDVAKSRKVGREQYEKNRDKILSQRQTPGARSATAAYMRQRRLADPYFRLLQNLRRRLWRAIVEQQGTSKKARTMELVGCSLDQLKAHLAAQFQPCMTWTNYGEWHVDHIRPCSSFDLRDKQQQAECFSYTNLQPLWKTDNHKKYSKWDGQTALTV